MIEYVKGDVLEPQTNSDNELVYIPHICNNIGKWGAGFVLALSNKWPHLRDNYIQWHQVVNPLPLGRFLIDRAEPGIFVANMIAQRGVKSSVNPKPIKYDALQQALTGVSDYAAGYEDGINEDIGDAFGVYSAFHMPKIGSGLAGGDWDRIEGIIKETLANFRVVVYTLD